MFSLVFARFDTCGAYTALYPFYVLMIAVQKHRTFIARPLRSYGTMSAGDQSYLHDDGAGMLIYCVHVTFSAKFVEEDFICAAVLISAY